MWALIGKVMVLALMATGVMRLYHQSETKAACSVAALEFEQSVTGRPQLAQLYAPANADHFAKRLSKVRAACRDAGGYEPDATIHLPRAVLVRADALEQVEQLASN